MIPEPGDANREITVTETFHLQIHDELSDKELKQIEADDQAIQIILLGLPEDIYVTVDREEGKLFNEWGRFTSNEEESIESYYHRFLKLMNDNKHFSKKIASNLKFLNNLQPEWSRHVTIVHQTKDLHTADYTQLYDFLKYNQKEMVGGNGGNQFRQYARQNVGNPALYNYVIGNQNQIGNGNLMAVRAEGNVARQNGNQIRCYNCMEVGHYARNCTVRPSGKKQKAKVSVNEIQMKYQSKVMKPKKVGTRESLATPKPRKSRLLLRWSPTGRLFDQERKIVDSSESNSHSDCVNGDNTCTSNSLEPKIKRFPNSTSLLDRLYFVKGLGYNLFSVWQFCDSDLEVAFRRNACFIRNLEGVDLLKGDRSTNLYTINLHEMASTSQICLMARASSTKSWLWHQRLSHLNFDTINDLARNDLVL
nr:retrovirus-related Pol polyprotein from transposon TNT 1-94 [Tanacetum cinerariifolium]